MGIKRFLIAVVLFIMSVQGFAQGIKITWGPETKLSRWTQLNKIIGGNENGFYSLFYDYRGFWFFRTKYAVIGRTDANLKLNFVKDLKIPNTNGKALAFKDIRYIDGHLSLFSSYYNRDMDKNFAFVHHVDDRGNLDKNIQEIDQISAEKKRNSGNFDFVMSKDSTKMLVYHNEPYQKGESEKFSYKVTDNKFNTIWTKQVTLPYKDNKFSVDKYLVSNSGDVYLLGTVYSEEKVRKKPDYKYIILAYSYKDDKFKTYDISLDDKFITDITFSVNEETNNIICAGFYAGLKSLSVVGTFYLRVDLNTAEVVAKGVKGFDKEFLENFNSKRKVRKGQGLNYFDLNNFIVGTDGSANLVAEQYYVIDRTTYNSNGTVRTSRYYYYNDIIVVNIGPDADIKWVSWIPKRQVSVNDGGFYSSFIVGVKDDKINIIYNDNKKNVSCDDPKKMKYMSNPKKSLAMLVTIDSEGDATKSILFSNKDQGLIIRPKISLQQNASDIFVFGIKGRKQKFGKISFN